MQEAVSLALVSTRYGSLSLESWGPNDHRSSRWVWSHFSVHQPKRHLDAGAVLISTKLNQDG